jgi:hypothetical protein
MYAFSQRPEFKKKFTIRGGCFDRVQKIEALQCNATCISTCSNMFKEMYIK